MIRVVRVTNPLQPSVDRDTREVEYQCPRTLEELVQDAQVAEGGTAADWKAWSDKVAVSLNGHVWARSLWTEVWPKDGDCIVIAPRVGNGGVFRALGELAIVAASAALIATGAGAVLGAALTGATLLNVSAGAIAMGNALMAGAVGIAGNLLISGISSLFRSPTKQSSPSYSFEGPTSLARSGTVIPKGYGTMVSGGNIISSFVDLEGIDQYINVLVCYGFGPARAIGSIQINGKAIESYQNVQYWLRYGSNDQLPIPGFDRIVNGYPQNTQCLAGVSIVVPGTGTRTVIGHVDVMFPGGVFFRTDKGNNIAAVITYEVYYRESGTTGDWLATLWPQETAAVYSYDTNGRAIDPPAWVVIATDIGSSYGVVYATDSGSHYPGEPWSGNLTVETFAPNGNHGTYTKTFYGEWQPANPYINQVRVVTWTQGFQDFVADSTQTIYNRTTIYYPYAAKWDVLIRKYGSARIHDDVYPGDNWSTNIGQDMWLHNVDEISLLNMAYPNMILVGVRALATSQLSGSNLNITAEIQYGLRTLDKNRLPAALQAYEEDNPACVAADMMLDRLYGGGQYPGIMPANIGRYIDEWIAGAELNDELVDDGNGNSIRRHVFNGVFDNEGNLWDQLSAVTSMSRAALVPMGRDYSYFIDGPATPVQMFSVGNIIADSFQNSYLELDARATQVEILIADKTRYYKQDNPIAYMDPANQNSGVPIKNVRIDGRGITDPAQAWHLARFRERCNEFLLRTGSFRCDVSAIASRPGNVVILQHDVPQWGWGGRTLPGSTATVLRLDRNDVEFVSGTSYSVIVLLPAVQRYSGTVTAAVVDIDSTGLVLGTDLTLSSFDNLSRVTRAILTAAGSAPVDCPIRHTVAGSVRIAPPAGFTPAAGMTYQLYDTDVMVTGSVASVAVGPDGMQVATLSAPLSQAPPEYSLYFYGQTGTQKLARITSIKRAGEFRADIEWIDYDERVYVDATPTIGETSALVTTNPGVTSLTAVEKWEIISGNSVPYVKLSWRNGPDTAGVAIYAQSLAAGRSITNGLPLMVARLPGVPTSWTTEAIPGSGYKYTVVGYDAKDNYQAFLKAPSVTITPVGVTRNLILGSNFTSGFTYWNLQGRASDTLVPTFDDDGQADYTVAGTAITAPQSMLYQVISPSKWTVGEYLMLSSYFEDTCSDPAAPNVGDFVASLNFYDSSNALISRVTASLPLSGVTPTVTRANSPSTAVPAGTVVVIVSVGIEGSTVDVPVGSLLTVSHLLLENSTTTQTDPSAWADIDVQGHVLDIFTSGISTGLRVQGSVLPSFTGAWPYTSTDSTATLAWENLIILWPDGANTQVQDASIEVTGLTASTPYLAYLYFDIINGGVKTAIPSSPVGIPGILSLTADAGAEAACRQDGRIPLTPGGTTINTVAVGGTGGGTGGGGVDPVYCTVRGTELMTPDGPVSNTILKQRFDAGESVYLMGRFGPERVLHAKWETVSEYYMLQIGQYPSFGASGSMTLKPEGGEHRWCSLLEQGTRVETLTGFRPMMRTLVAESVEVLHIELVGPSHEYLAVNGVWTHNMKNLGGGDEGIG